MNDSILGLLKGVELFSELNEEQLKMLGNLVVSQNFVRDETVVLEGDDSVQALYLIASGSVQVYMTGVDGGRPFSRSLNAVTSSAKCP